MHTADRESTSAGAPATGIADSDTEETHLPESAEHFEHVLRRLVIAKEKNRAVPAAELR